MARNILVINVDLRETRVALIENGVIAELQIERAANRGSVGNVVLGKVTRVLPGMQAAFIDIGMERAAFLHVEDLIRPDDFEAYLAGGGTGANEDGDEHIRGESARRADYGTAPVAEDDDDDEEIVIGPEKPDTDEPSDPAGAEEHDGDEASDPEPTEDAEPEEGAADADSEGSEEPDDPEEEDAPAVAAEGDSGEGPRAPLAAESPAGAGTVDKAQEDLGAPPGAWPEAATTATKGWRGESGRGAAGGQGSQRREGT